MYTIANITRLLTQQVRNFNLVLLKTSESQSQLNASLIVSYSQVLLNVPLNVSYT